MKEKLKLLILKIKNSLLRVFVFGKGNTTIKVLAPIALVFVFVLVPMHAAYAGIGDYFANAATNAITWFVGWLIGDIFIPLMGAIMIWITKGIVMVAGYNGFGQATAVTVGWVLMRDMANMIFVIALLMMAFGTMLDIESMGNSKQLPRLLVMAVAVNFSKMITLFLIDISQVVMLTFVAAFRATAAGNFVKAFGITDWFTKVASTDTTTDQFVQTIIGMLLAAILTVVATGVLIVFLSFLVIRMVTLWMLIIFSPLAFGLSVLAKKGKSYYDKWWDELVKTLITGPLIAFFLWLTLATAGAASGGVGAEIIANSRNVSETTSDVVSASGTTSSAVQHGTKAFDLDVLITFVVSIAMLMLGLQITQEVGAAGIGKAMAFKDKTMGFAGRMAKKSALWTGKKVGGAAYNAKIPFSGGASLAGVVAGAGAGIAGSKLGKAVGLNKEYTDLQRAEKKAAGLRMMGQDTKARALEQATISEHRKKLEPLSQDQVEAKLNELEKQGKKGSLEYRAAGLDLAGRGAFNTNHANLDLIADGSPDENFKKDLISAANAKGANYVDLGKGNATDAIQGMMSKADFNPSSMFGNIDKLVEKTRDRNGNEVMGDPHASEKLLNVSKSMFDSNRFGDLNRQKVRKALLLAMKNNPKQKDALLKKYNELHRTDAKGNPTAGFTDANFGTSTDGTISSGGFSIPDGNNDLVDQKKMIDTQQQNLTKGYTGELRKENGAVAPKDAVLIDAVSQKMKPAESRQVVDAVHKLQALTSDLKDASGNYDPVKIRMAYIGGNSHLSALRKPFADLDSRETTGVTSPDGTDLTFQGALQSSHLAESIGVLRQKLNELSSAAPSARSDIERQITDLQNTINTMTQQMLGGSRKDTAGTRKSYQKEVVKKLPRTDSRIKSYMNSAKSETRLDEKLKQMTLAYTELAKSVRTLSNRNMQVNLPVQARKDLEVLGRQIASLKISDDSRALPDRLDELKRLHDEYEKLRKTT